MKVTPSRTVIYALSAADAKLITESRPDKPAMPGATYPAIVVTALTDTKINAQVLLDSQSPNMFYVENVEQSPKEDRGKAGCWHWAQIVA